MVAEAASEHLVPQFGHRFDGRRLGHIARISADSSLTKVDEDGLDRWAEGDYLIVDELLRGIVFHQHRHELDDVGILEVESSASHHGLR